MNFAENFNKKNTDSFISGRDIVIVGIQPWHYELGSNCKNIARELSKNNRVIYVNIPISRKTYLSRNKTEGVKRHCEIIKTKGEQLYKINDNMWEFYPASLIEPINSLKSVKLFRFFNKINNKRFAKDILHATRRLNFNNIILFNDNDIYTGFHLKEFLTPALYIYYCRDFLQGNPYWKRHTSYLEPELIKKSDLVVANSTYYSEYCAQYNPSRSYYIGQGCNIELFNNKESILPAEDIKHIASPVIGYVGAVDSGRLDLKIIEIIATYNEKWNVVLVGPEDDTFTNSNLHQLHNITFIGRKDIKELPSYIKSFDVCINPQAVNKLTIGNYPLKIDEYLAMGKPIAATRTKAMSIFEEYTYLANKPEEYPALIEKAIKENTTEKAEKRIAFANTHTWENSIRELYKAINQYIHPNKEII